MTTPTLTLVPDPDDNDDDHQAVSSPTPAAESWPAPPAPASDDGRTPLSPPAPTDDLDPSTPLAPVVVLDDVWQPDGDRKPLLPIWLRDGATRRAAARWWVGHSTHVAAFHTLRLPLYTGRIAVRAPIGVGRCSVVVSRWLIDARAAGERDAMREALRADGGSGAPLARLAHQHRNSVLARLGVFMFA